MARGVETKGQRPPPKRRFGCGLVENQEIFHPGCNPALGVVLQCHLQAWLSPFPPPWPIGGGRGRLKNLNYSFRIPSSSTKPTQKAHLLPGKL